MVLFNYIRVTKDVGLKKIPKWKSLLLGFLNLNNGRKILLNIRELSLTQIKSVETNFPNHFCFTASKRELRI